MRAQKYSATLRSGEARSLRSTSRCHVGDLVAKWPLGAKPRRGKFFRLFFQSLEVFIIVSGMAWADEPATVVIANKRVPESEELARYYLKARNISEENLCLLDLTKDERMGRIAYEDQLRDPLLAFLRKRGLVEQVQREAKSVGAHESSWNAVSSSLRYIVSMYGVPVRIADTRAFLVRKISDMLQVTPSTDAAAVDSELAMLLNPGYDIRGRSGNPMYNKVRTEDIGGLSHTMVMATRLDGPDPATVRRMIDDAITAERYGLLGRAYFDSRSLRNDDYFEGDFWIREACERFRREGYECVLDQDDQVWGKLFPMEDAAVYMGWYTDQAVGPFTRSTFHFKAGAVAYHIHSTSASILRSSTNFWAGPLLSHDATVTMGAVYEPYLAFSPNLQIFSDRLCSGHTFGESAYMAMPVLSWQITVVGDPLYRPFRYTLDEQIQHLEKDGRSDVDWAYLRKINLLAREGRFNLAMDYARERIKARDSLVLRERLGDLYAMNQLYDAAGEQYGYVVENAVTPETAFRVGTRYLYLLRLQKNDTKAGEVEHQLRTTWSASPWLPMLDKVKTMP